jgi:putative hydrolase
MLGRLVRMNPRDLIRSAGSGELATLLWPESSQALLERLTAAMTMVEGYAEHVMDAVGDRLDPRFAELRLALERDRERRGLLDSLVSKLLGLEMKMAQYRRGKAFSDEVVAAHGIRTLNRAWRGPEELPTRAELDHPAAWVERVGVAFPDRLRRLFG